MKRSISISNTALNNIVQKTRKKRLLKRMVALLSMLVLLMTVNQMKFVADTLERRPACGLAEHAHTGDCYDESGNIACGLEPHAHTDACYQTRPAGDDGEAVEEDVSAEAVDRAVADTERFMIGEALPEGLEPDGGEAIATVDEAEANLTYYVGEASPVLLSEVLEAVGLAAGAIEEVGQIVDDAHPEGMLRLADAAGDVAIYAARSFDEVELLVLTEDDLYIIELVGAVVSEPTEEPTPEPTEEPTPEPTEEPTPEPTEEPTPEPTVEPEESIEPEETVEPEATEEPEVTEEPEAAVEPDDGSDDAESAAVEPGLTGARAYAAGIDLTGVAGPFSLIEWMDRARPVADEAVPAELETAEAADAPATEGGALEAPVELPPENWTLEYNADLLAVEYVDGDYFVTPVAEFDETVLAVDTGAAAYEMTLTNQIAAPETPGMAGVRRVSAEGADYTLYISVPEDAHLPETAEFKARAVEEDAYGSAALAAVAGGDAGGYAVLALFDLTIYDGGQVIQPDAALSVSVDFGDGLAADTEVFAVHFPGSGEQAGQASAARSPMRAAMIRTQAVQDVQSDGAENEMAADTIDAANNGGGIVTFQASSFSIYSIVGKTIERNVLASDGRSYRITVTYGPEAEIPENAALEAYELKAGERDGYLSTIANMLSLDAEAVGYARFFDISIVADGEKIQPSAPVDVKIELADAEGERLSVVHFGEEAEVLDAAQDKAETGVEVSFEADGFSVYAIVDAPEPVSAEARAVMSLDELQAGVAYYLSYNNGKSNYFTNVLNSNSAIIETDNPEAASEWYFEPAEDGAYYIYTLIEGERMYLENTSGNLVGLSDQGGTSLTLSEAGEAKFYFKSSAENKWLQHSNGGGGIRFYTDNNNAVNSQITITYASSYTPDDDPYGLDGKTYGIAYNDESATAAALTTQDKTVSNTRRLEGLDMLIRPDVLNNAGLLLVAQGSDIVEWTFHAVSDIQYYVTATVDGQAKYLTIDGAAVTLEDAPADGSLITVTPGTGSNSGKWQLYSKGYSLNLFDNASNGFGGAAGSGATTWLNFVEKSVLTDDDFNLYTARKVSVSDGASVYDGQQVIIYTRVWNDTTKRYEFYAVDHDGTLVRCYDGGDTIEWIGSQVNTALWDFTEYYYAGTQTPNHYYELRNVQYGNYIAPQLTGGQTLSNAAIGINLNGRRYGENYTTIIAWDDGSYAYAGLKTENGRVVSCQLSEAEDFYFAVMKPAEQEKNLTEVKTIDSNAYGISMKMIDFDNERIGVRPNWRDKAQNDFFNGDGNTAGLLTTNLAKDGYPLSTVEKTGHSLSLSQLFNGMTPVNHLFIESIYNESGYFEYDSTQNFAHLNDDGTFTVYDQLLAVGDSSGETRTHGQFLPYNDILTASTAPYTNQTDVLGAPLADVDPRKGEEMYWVSFDEVNYFFGMEMEASFTQTASGLDAWGHDIIFEFSGDDDFWLYVDGELVLDLGGIDRAKTGTINFRTGVVTRSRGGNTTLYDLFRANYRARGMSEAEIAEKLDGIFTRNADGQYVFKDYTNHTMKMFYMERGAGASNLHMRFNLAAVRPGAFILSKAVSGTDLQDNDLLEFPYQIFYTLKDDGESAVHQLTNRASVVYEDTNTPVTYKESFTPAGGETPYSDVFFLKPGQSAEISLPDNVANYYVVECGVNPRIYDRVTANGEALASAATANGDRLDYAAPMASLEARSSVKFDNHVKEGAMRTLSITKRLYDQNGTDRLHYPADATLFSFRLYLGSENADDEDIPLADMYSYYVKNPDGYYCRWDETAQAFASLGKKDYAALTDAEREKATFNTSMNGSISKIPADYTVEVRNLIVDSKFKVEERDYEIPKGYTLRLKDGYTRLDGEYTESYTPISGRIVADDDPEIEVRNQKGWGLTIEKVWTDADFMARHGDVYFAVYLDGEMLADSVRRLDTASNSIYYFFGNLQDGIPFEDYIVREVKVTAPTVDSDGRVTEYGEVTPVEDGKEINIGGRPIGGEDRESGYIYTVAYDQGEPTMRNENVRTDTVTNSRPGIELYKTDWDGKPLSGAVFTLCDESGENVAAASYTSGADGLITVAYLSPGNYTLTETAAPKGFAAMEAPMAICVGENGDIDVSGVDGRFYAIETENGAMAATIKLKNRPAALQVRKVDADTGEGIEGVRFALYRQVTTAEGGERKDYRPMTGYADIVTDENGILAAVSMDLDANTYYLTETAAAAGYRPLPDDLCFTIGSDGTVTVETEAYVGWLREEADDGTGNVSYVLAIENARLETVEIRKISAGTDFALEGASFALYAASDYDDVNNRVKESAEALTEGATDGDGLLPLGALPLGEYRLVETAAPRGYNLLDAPVRIYVRDEGVSATQGTGGSEVVQSEDNGAWRITVWNNPGYALPETGGRGVAPFTAVGAALIALALILLLRRQRA